MCVCVYVLVVLARVAGVCYVCWCVFVGCVVWCGVMNVLFVFSKCVFVNICIYTYIYIYIYTHVYLYLYKHIHIYIYI